MSAEYADAVDAECQEDIALELTNQGVQEDIALELTNQDVVGLSS